MAKTQPLPVITRPVRALLLQAARDAATRAYCPYSHFPVGAAVLTLDGQIHTGCNVENVSYGLTLCAERNALAQAVSAGCRAFAALAIVGGTARPAMPCGACRQVLAEFCPPGMPLFLARLARGGRVRSFTLNRLLPHGFSLLD